MKGGVLGLGYSFCFYLVKCFKLFCNCSLTQIFTSWSSFCNLWCWPRKASKALFQVNDGSFFVDKE